MYFDDDYDDETCPKCGHDAESHNDSGAYCFGQLVNYGYHMCYDVKNKPDGTPGPQFNKDGTQNWCGCTWRP